MVEGLDNEPFAVDVIGDLASETEAKDFVQHLIDLGRGPQSLVETGVNGQPADMWPKVYEVCGRNIGLLVRCAGEAQKQKSWEMGLDSIIDRHKVVVEKGLYPEDHMASSSRSPPAWRDDQGKFAYRQISRAKNHAVSRNALQAMVGRAALRSMVEWNLLALRTKSSLAKDLQADAFAEKSDTVLVTMPSPAMLYCVKELDRAGKL